MSTIFGETSIPPHMTPKGEYMAYTHYSVLTCTSIRGRKDKRDRNEVWCLRRVGAGGGYGVRIMFSSNTE